SPNHKLWPGLVEDVLHRLLGARIHIVPGLLGVEILLDLLAKSVLVLLGAQVRRHREWIDTLLEPRRSVLRHRVTLPQLGIRPDRATAVRIRVSFVAGPEAGVGAGQRV